MLRRKGGGLTFLFFCINHTYYNWVSFQKIDLQHMQGTKREKHWSHGILQYSLQLRCGTAKMVWHFGLAQCRMDVWPTDSAETARCPTNSFPKHFVHSIFQKTCLLPALGTQYGSEKRVSNCVYPYTPPPP